MARWVVPCGRSAGQPAVVLGITNRANHGNSVVPPGRSPGRIRPFGNAHAARTVLFVTALILAPHCVAGAGEDFEQGKRAFRAGDIVTAMVPLKRASQAGHAGAQALYAQILDRSEFNEEAVAWFRKSAEQSDPDGQYGLGSMLAAGEGVERDLVAARGWMEKAASQGHVLAINLLAQSYINGQLGLTAADRASPQALAVLIRAADIDFLPAIEALAQAYVSGGYGAAPDPASAEKYAAKLRARPGAKTGKGGKK